MARTSRTRFAAVAATVALAAASVAAPLLAGPAADAKGKGKAKPASDVVVQSVKVGPDGGGSTSRTVLVQVRNHGTSTVGPFVVALTADRQGASRPAQNSAAVSLGPNQSTTVSFPAIGCKWLNGANGATLTAATNPKPVPGEDGSGKNNRLTAAPNLDYSGHPECSGV